MNRIISIFIILVFGTGLSGCTQSNYGNTPEQQRQNAQDAQRELSTDVKR